MSTYYLVIGMKVVPIAAIHDERLAREMGNQVRSERYCYDFRRDPLLVPSSSTRVLAGTGSGGAGHLL
jgi:hypothetical protein